MLDDAEVTPGLRGIRQREAAFGPDRWLRVCMRRDPMKSRSPQATDIATALAKRRPRERPHVASACREVASS